MSKQQVVYEIHKKSAKKLHTAKVRSKRDK